MERLKGGHHTLVRNQGIVCLVVWASLLGGWRNTLAIDASSASVRPVQSTEKSGNLAITIEASRPQLTAGSGFGLTAEIKNTSDKAVILTPSATVLLIPPELQGSGVAWDTAYYAFFPTETKPNHSTTAVVITEPNNSTTAVVIPPTDSYIVKWAWDRSMQGTGVGLKRDPGTDPTEKGSENEVTSLLKSLPPFARDLLDAIASELQFTFFSPGDYKVDVVARYQFQSDGEDQYQTVIQSALIHVNAPESVIIFGALIGGLLGHIISRIYRPEDSRQNSPLLFSKVGNFLGGAAGSMLLAAIVTILLARISESQFLVRININDFWGAIAVGFIASISGIKILDKWITPRESERETIAKSDGSEAAPTDRASDRNFSQAISARAYSIYERRQKSGVEGDQVSDWVEAEKELGLKPRGTSGERPPGLANFLSRIVRRNSEDAKGADE